MHVVLAYLFAVGCTTLHGLLEWNGLMFTVVCNVHTVGLI